MLSEIALEVLAKVSNLLIQESDSLLGVEDLIQWFETQLRTSAQDADNLVCLQKALETIYDFEDVIDELIIRSAKKRTRNTLIRIFLALADDIPKHFFHVLAILDLIDYYKLRNKLELLQHDFSFAFSRFRTSGSWQKSFALYDLSTGNTVISPVITKLATLATQQQLSSGIRKQFRMLRDEFKPLHSFLKVVESKGLSEYGVRWMEELFDVCCSTENVVGLFMQLQIKRNLVWAPPKFISQHKLVRQMAQIKEKICNISRRSYQAVRTESFSPSNYLSSFRREERELPFAADQLDMVSFQEDVDGIIAQLLKDDPRCLTISIVGVAGTGKTSLASLIYHSKTIADNFPHRVWVYGHEIEIMKQILNQDDGSDLYRRDETDESYENRLRQKVNAFFAEKKYLIVSDGSYARRFWRKMGGTFRDISNGTRIIFTIRHLDHAPPVTDTNFIYRLHLRSDYESLALFSHSWKIGNSPKLEESIKKDILQKCGGLPGLIVKLVEVLSERGIEEWSRVLHKLNQDEEHWLQVLEEINRYLPLKLRRCLFYFGLFPNGYRIPARRLIALWVAEGLGRQQNEEKFPEHVAESCLMELINYNMVQVTERKLNGKIKKCCLPEALRLHWFAKAKEANFLEGHDQKTAVTPMRRLADHLDPNDAIFDHIHGNNSSSMYSCYKHLVSFLSFDTRQESRAGDDVGNFLARCISSNSLLFLWVLDLENVYKPELPKAVGQLTLLRYLGLRSTYLGILPMFIDKLLNLQTLDLKRAHISNLRSIIWKMQKLRHLLLDESFRSVFASRPGDGYLPELQTLRGVHVDEESLIRNGLDTLLNVKKLGLKCKMLKSRQHMEMSSQLDAVANWVQNLKQLQSLKLKSFNESNQPWDLHLKSLSTHMDLASVYLVGRLKNQNLISELPQNLVELTLSASGLGKDPMQTLDKLQSLRILILLKGSFTGKKMVCSFGGFPKLEVLKFKKLEPLEEWNVEEGALASLKELEIEFCTSLKMLPKEVQRLKFLHELKLINVPVLSSRINYTQNDDGRLIIQSKPQH